MEQALRQQVARDLCQRLAAMHGPALIVAGMRAPAEPLTPFDPLELLVVAQAPVARPRHTVIMQNAPVTIETLALAELETVLRAPDLRWPAWTGWLATVQPLVGSGEQIESWLTQASALDEETFFRSILPHLPRLVFGCFSALRASAARRSEGDATLLAIHLLEEMLTALCLINRRWLTRQRMAGFHESYHFARQPRDWPILVEALIAARERDEIVLLAGTLVSNYWSLLARCGLNIEHHQTVTTVPL